MNVTGKKEYIQRFMAPSGRVAYRDLQDLANEHNEQRFVQLVRYHFLVGVSVLQGELRDDLDNVESTKIFKYKANGKANSGKDIFDLSKVVFPLLPGKDRHENEPILVGQDDDNNIVISDYSISHDHLSIRIDSDGRFFIKDLDSKNSTLIQGKKIVPGKEVEIVEDETIQIGRYQFIFTSPGMLYARLRGLDVQQSIVDLINHLGKVDYKKLKALAKWRKEDMFVQLVHNPSLVGMALFKGSMVEPEFKVDDDDCDETKLFRNENLDKQIAVTLEYLSRNIFPIVHKIEKEQDKDCLKIGRLETNDLCMLDSSISRIHGQIRIAGTGHYFYTDFKSRNGSWINGKKVGNIEVALYEGDKLKIGRYLFHFVFPSTLYKMLNKKK
ncbi:MAG: FHA domain-containing protein [Magnetococcales bacterium]|nr:FHA domain-containing protein [Magnetococcales bacterium]